MKNLFCDKETLTNEASVEAWFVNPLLEFLGYQPSDIKLKTSIKEIKVGKGSKSEFYKPDYILVVSDLPTVVVDAKSPDEIIENWTLQCSSYCLELNKLYDENPVKFYFITNGLATSLYRWDQNAPLVTLSFADFVADNEKLERFTSTVSKSGIQQLFEEVTNKIKQSQFRFETIPLDVLGKKFQHLHRYIWTQEKKTPSAAFMELIKIVFVKLQKDKEIHQKLGHSPKPKTEDVIFSVNWIRSQTEADSPTSDLLFKNLIKGFEKDITEKKKKRFFDRDAEINLGPRTIEKIVEELEHIDLFDMDEDVHGRMFESFLDATIRGKDLGQYFTPRDIVQLMVDLADLKVTKQHTDSVLDACCGSGGFLINAMTKMAEKAKAIPGATNVEVKEILKKIKTNRIYGIDAGSDPPIYRIARMNMYLHGDGGSNIFFADSLDKNIPQIGKSDMENDAQIAELRKMLLADKRKFDIILSNPPFSLNYSRDKKDEKHILDQYDLSNQNDHWKSSLLSSVMFLERYKDLVASDGKIFAIIDDSVLSGHNYKDIREYIRNNFIMKGIISLPGDAFRRAAARVKTSILILRLKHPDEEQPSVFMAKSVYLGLDEKTAKRIGISRNELADGKETERNRIVSEYRAFEEGVPGPYSIPTERLTDRLDVKYCADENSRRKPLWISKGLNVVKLDEVLKQVEGRSIDVEPDEEYDLLKVNYDGQILDAETKTGEECSYSKLYFVKTWDVVFSNMGVGRGAIGIVPPYHEGKFLSNEYTILTANSREEAIFYTTLLRTKEILGDILSSTTGMNRGRIKWENMRNVEVPVYNKSINDLSNNVIALEGLWDSYRKYQDYKIEQTEKLATDLDLEGDDARSRWLAFKPPE